MRSRSFPGMARCRSARAALVLALMLFSAACVHRAPPPSADVPPPGPLALGGTTVMVMPAQPGRGASPDLAAAFDAELAFWLADRAPRVHWIPAADVERLVRNAPAIRVDVHNLDVRAFEGMRVRRIGDPLFGDIHNLGGVLDARLALIPAALAYLTPADSATLPLGPGTGGKPPARPVIPAPGRMEVTAAVVSTFGGEVVWLGVVAGEPAAIDSPRAVASAARALARALLP